MTLKVGPQDSYENQLHHMAEHNFLYQMLLSMHECCFAIRVKSTFKVNVYEWLLGHNNELLKIRSSIIIGCTTLK